MCLHICKKTGCHPTKPIALKIGKKKVDAIVQETVKEDMRLISGIPPWCQMYFDRLSAVSGGKKIKDIFPNFKLYVHGGVNF
jgi:hypothetical protein